jgi:hypothetical protein
LYYFLQNSLVYLPYISLSILHLFVILCVELVITGVLLKYCMQNDWNRLSRQRAILGFIVFNLAFYQPFYNFYMDPVRESIPVVQKISPLLVIMSYGLLAFAAILSFIWWRAWWGLWEGLYQYWQNVRRVQVGGGKIDDANEEETWLEKKIPWLQTVWGKRLVVIGQMLILWSVVIARTFSFDGFMDNETDALPSALQFINHSWLPNDWYLNLNIVYRQAFSLILGPLVSLLGFEWGAVAGRLLVYLIFAISVYYLFKTLRLNFSVGVVVLFIFLGNQSLVAAEWIVKGVDTKSVAYAMALLSLVAFFRKRFSLGWLFAGFALSFHMLIGVYSLICLGISFIMNKSYLKGSWRLLFKYWWILILSGFWGLLAAVNQIYTEIVNFTDPGWDVYINYRVPFHVLPRWLDGIWQYELLVFILVFLLIYLFAVPRVARFYSAYALGSVFLFCLGLVIDRLGQELLLKFYWFRLPDVMVPLFGLTLTAFLVGCIFNKRTFSNKLPGSTDTQTSAIFSLIVMFIAGFISIQSVFIVFDNSVHFDPVNTWQKHPETEMLEWIAVNTPKDSVFLVDPMMDYFYIEAQRPMFVSFKSSPQSAPDILEWYERIVLVNGGKTPEKRGFLAYKELTPNFYDLNADQVRKIVSMYHLDYFLGSNKQDLPFDVVRKTTRYTLYRLNPDN